MCTDVLLGCVRFCSRRYEESAVGAGTVLCDACLRLFLQYGILELLLVPWSCQSWTCGVLEGWGRKLADGAAALATDSTRASHRVSVVRRDDCLRFPLASDSRILALDSARADDRRLLCFASLFGGRCALRRRLETRRVLLDERLGSIGDLRPPLRHSGARCARLGGDLLSFCICAEYRLRG